MYYNSDTNLCWSIFVCPCKNLKKKPANSQSARSLPCGSAIVQSLQSTPEIENWQYLIARPHPWRKQLYIKGRKLLASTIWRDMTANGMSPSQAAENWDLPLSAIYEAIDYCQNNQELLKLEAEEERYRLSAKKVELEPANAA